MTDIGTGSYTVIAQTAAEMMGVRLERVIVRLGDSNFPVSCGSGGQWGGNSATAGVYAACMKLREAVAQKAGLNAGDAVFANGQVRVGSRSVPLGEVAGEQGLVAEDSIEFGDLNKKFAAGDLRRALRRGRRRCRHAARRACGACSRSAPPAASSTRRPRAAR